jgi:hypothetical protein
MQTLRAGPVPASGGPLAIVLEADRSFRPPGDARELSVILESIRIE